MNYKLLTSGIYRGYNPFTNHLLTSWDIQVWYLWWCFPRSYWLFWRFSHSYQENTGPRCIAASGMGTYRWRRPTQWTCHNARSTEPRYKAMNKKGRKPVWTHTHRIHENGTPPPRKLTCYWKMIRFLFLSKGHYAICIFVWMRVVGFHSLKLT